MKRLSIRKGQLLERFNQNYYDRFNENPTGDELDDFHQLEIFSDGGGFDIRYPDDVTPAFELVLEETIEESIDVLLQGEIKHEDYTSRAYD